eukprot:scaffold11242_cov75-Isochrysis_galbana.AAC.2
MAMRRIRRVIKGGRVDGCVPWLVSSCYFGSGVHTLVVRVDDNVQPHELMEGRVVHAKHLRSNEGESGHGKGKGRVGMGRARGEWAWEGEGEREGVSGHGKGKRRVGMGRAKHRCTRGAGVDADNKTRGQAAKTKLARHAAKKKTPLC